MRGRLCQRELSAEAAAPFHVGCFRPRRLFRPKYIKEPELTMWPDNETERDFLNFSGVADTVAEIIIQARGRPISIGVSGAWGIGKSSMIKLTQASLAKRPRKEGEREFIFVEFNAWLYQGYDDARAALMDVIATKLEAEAMAREKGLDKGKALLKRVNWLRAAKLVGGSAVAMSFGLPPTGLIGEIWGLGQRALAGGVDGKLLEEAKGEAGEVAKTAGGLLKPREETSPPKEIQALRETFEETLDELGVTLVVLIDDLDGSGAKFRKQFNKGPANTNRLRQRELHSRLRVPCCLCSEVRRG